MKINYLSVNRNQLYCMSVKKAKEYFKDTDLSIFFCSNARFSFESFRISKYSKEIKGQIICVLIANSGSSFGQIDFYAISKAQFSDTVKKEFTNELLPELYAFYDEQKNDKTMIKKEWLFIVELQNEKLIKHKILTHRG